MGQLLGVVKSLSMSAPGLLYSARKAPGSELAAAPTLLATSMGSSGAMGPAALLKSHTLPASATAVHARMHASARRQSCYDE